MCFHILIPRYLCVRGPSKLHRQSRRIKLPLDLVPQWLEVTITDVTHSVQFAQSTCYELFLNFKAFPDICEHSIVADCLVAYIPKMFSLWLVKFVVPLWQFRSSHSVKIDRLYQNSFISSLFYLLLSFLVVWWLKVYSILGKWGHAWPFFNVCDDLESTYRFRFLQNDFGQACTADPRTTIKHQIVTCVVQSNNATVTMRNSTSKYNFLNTYPSLPPYACLVYSLGSWWKIRRISYFDVKGHLEREGQVSRLNFHYALSEDRLSDLDLLQI